MAQGSIRFRLTFDRDITSRALHNLTRQIMYRPLFLPPTIDGLADLIQYEFGINAPGGLALSIDTWRLPLCSSTELLRDDDSLKVAQSSGPEPSLPLGLAAMVDGGEDTLTQPALAGAAPAKPSNSGADIFVDISASSGSGASRSGMSEDSEEIPDAEIDAAQDVYEKVMQNFPGKPSTPGTALLHAGRASDRAASQPSMPAGSRPPANTPTMRPKVSDEKAAWRKAQYERFMTKHFPHS
ncbi:g7267 [Coccomyxa viridis]|uniref:G7267 protein n=1 Tax=Coccomyxa viridis TaxID=1274662 RepID=A0ABP1G406_9CHLO